MKFLTTILIFLGLTIGAQARIIETDFGGDMFERLQTMRTLDEAKIEYHINGVCISACTMFLGLDHVCMEENSLLEFHSGATIDKDGIPQISSFANSILMLTYPPNVQKWVTEHNALKSLDLTGLSSQEAYKLGVKPCLHTGE